MEEKILCRECNELMCLRKFVYLQEHSKLELTTYCKKCRIEKIALVGFKTDSNQSGDRVF